MQEALIVRRETHVPAPPATVFAFLTDPEKILRWMGTEAQVEPQPGGLGQAVYRHHLAEGAAGKTSSGDVDEIDPTGARLDLRLRTHPAQEFLLIG